MLMAADQFRDGGGFVLGRKMCVAQGHLNIRVAEQLANGVQIDTPHHQLAGEVVAHIVPVEVLNACV